jgi:hypothetical protein
LIRTSTDTDFLIFVFDLEYLVRVQICSELLHAKMNPTFCLFGSRFACAPNTIFSAEPCSKSAGETSVVLWVTAREERNPTSRNLNQNRAALWRIFSSNKSLPAKRKTGLIRTSRRLDSFLHEAVQNFEVFSNIQELN